MYVHHLRKKIPPEKSVVKAKVFFICQSEKSNVKEYQFFTNNFDYLKKEGNGTIGCVKYVREETEKGCFTLVKQPFSADWIHMIYLLIITFLTM